MKACQALVQIGQELTLFVPRNDRTRPDEKDLSSLYGLKTTFPLFFLPAVPIFRHHDFAWSAAIQARNMNADIVIAWPLQAALASISFGIPTILELHGPPEGRFGPAMFKLFLARPGLKRLVFITRALQQIVEEAYPEWEINSISCVAPNGVELERYADLPDPALARKQLGLAERMTTAYTGHLYPGRGMGLLVELARRFPEIQFLWIGGRAEDTRYWENRIATEALVNILFMGFIPNDRLPLFQAAADILLMPYERVISGSSGGNSAAYASPMKMFEYMACGRPILSSDLPVLREVINNNNAMLCPPGDIESWTDKLSDLVKDESLRKRLADQAFQDVASYTWEKRAQKIVSGILDE
jgi:glycosyltransferase involved in cell wall biosynthesis